MKKDFWRNKKVFLTGHTGFKGGWLSLWLQHLGAEVFGYSLKPHTDPSFYSVCDIERVISGQVIGDIRDFEKLKKAIHEFRPEIIIHLAAQPLVRESYSNPIDTYSTNVLGTVNILEAIRTLDSVRSIVNVTTDKCYENFEFDHAYKEEEPLGGYDPYSSSKACSELVSSAYRRSFLNAEGKQLATARAGNVIGGGDWSKDRLIPDFFRAYFANNQLEIRSPNAIRPWQHVLEPLYCYLLLAEKLYSNDSYSEAWNFGPNQSDAKPVSWIMNFLCSKLADANWQVGPHSNLHEAGLLKLDISKAQHRLNYQPIWDLSDALEKTIEWYVSWSVGKNMKEVSLNQISLFEDLKGLK